VKVARGSGNSDGGSSGMLALDEWAESSWYRAGVKVVQLEWLRAVGKTRDWLDETPFLLQAVAPQAMVDAHKQQAIAAQSAEGTTPPSTPPPTATAELLSGIEAAATAAATDAAAQGEHASANKQKLACTIENIRVVSERLSKLAAGGQDHKEVADIHTQLLEDREMIEELIEMEREQAEGVGDSEDGGGGGGGGGGMSFANSGDMDAEFMELMGGGGSSSDDDDDDDGSGDDNDEGDDAGEASERPAKRHKSADPESAPADAETSSSDDDSDDEEGDAAADEFAADLERQMQNADSGEDSGEDGE
jgi:hypothetical protein